MKIQLSSEQMKIIEANENHLAIIAGAGTGKTTVITEKIKTLINNGVDPLKILAITFTKKAAHEMTLRIKNDLIKVMTFDAYCYSLIKQDIKINLIEDNIPFFRKDVLSFHLYDADNKKGIKPIGYQKYVAYKKINRLMDFNDIEYLALSKIKNESFDYVLVDEFQDTNELQLNILKNLVKRHTKTIVVGDPDQSIYAFRGAKSDIFDNYIKYFNAKVLTLTNNYRSKSLIIKGANNIISYNKIRIKKLLKPFHKELGNIIFKKITDENQLVKYIINEYESLLGKNKSFAVLYRNHNIAYELRKIVTEYNYKISLLTIHEAKGLEFDVVFIIGLNQGVFPSQIINKVSNLDEERRLMFVAITRAKQRLYLLFNSKPSLFIQEMIKYNKK